ncbi:MAG: energy transducer TonB [Acidobacteriota bacterium]
MKNRAQVEQKSVRPVLSEEQIERENELYQIFLHGKEDRIQIGPLLIAIVIHAVILFVTIPTFSVNIMPRSPKKIIKVRRWTPPPPPKREKPREIQVEKLKTLKVPVPDPTPDEPEPIEEPEPEPEPDEMIEFDPDADYILGAPEPPRMAGPLMAGVGDVSNPVLIAATRVQPIYPELARQAKVQGRVILQAVIFKDGTVGDIQVLQMPGEKLGFAESAIEAVGQWRYQAALQNGRPVDVIFTIVVDFTLR